MITLKIIEMHDYMETIGEVALDECKSLKSVVLPEHLKQMLTLIVN